MAAMGKKFGALTEKALKEVHAKIKAEYATVVGSGWSTTVTSTDATLAEPGAMISSGTYVPLSYIEMKSLYEMPTPHFEHHRLAMSVPGKRIEVPVMPPEGGRSISNVDLRLEDDPISGDREIVLYVDGAVVYRRSIYIDPPAPEPVPLPEVERKTPIYEQDEEVGF